MNNYIKHAYREFQVAGWCDKDNQFTDEMQQSICENVIELLEVFNNHGHSGSSASYVIQMFTKLANFDPIGHLTGADDEWRDVSEFSGKPLWQNKRCGRVFKNQDGEAFDVEGIVFYRWQEEDNGRLTRLYFSSMNSQIPVQFPYTPTTVYQEYIDPNTAS